jgi:tetratricopeptide (TPR) repeat protein
MQLLQRRVRRFSPWRSRSIAFVVITASLIVPLASFAQLKEGTETWYLERGRKNMEIGNYKAAIEAYQKAAKLNPNNREAMKQLGVAYEKQGLTTDAIKQYDQYLERFHDDADIAFKQGDYLGWSRYAYRREDAIKYYKMGLAVREDEDRRHKLAQLLSRDKKQLDEAVEQYRVLLKAKPNNAAYREEYRKLLVWDDKYLKEAVEEYRRYSKEKKGDFETDHTLATLLARQNPKGKETLELYGDLVKRKPNDEGLRREYADLLAGSSTQNAQAIEQYRKLVASDPRPETRHQFAKLLSQDRSHLDEAVAEYKKLLEAQPNNAEWREEYRKLLLWDPAHLEDSIREQRKLVKEKPSDDAKHTLAELLARQNPNSDEARSLYGELLQRKPNDLALRSEYADLLASDPARRAAAIAEYRAIVSRDSRPETRHKLAQLLASDRADLDEAVEEYRKLLDAEPGNPVWNAEYRELLLWDDRYLGNAVQEYRRLADQRPGDVEVQHNYARLIAREDPKSKEALSRYAELVKRQPGDVAVRLEYADLLANQPDRRADAIAEYRTVVAKDPKPETRHKLAQLLAQDRANSDAALEQYRQLLADQPNNAEWRAEYRKVLLWDERNTKEAIIEYRRYAQEKPGDFEVQHTLAKLLARVEPRGDETMKLYRGLVDARPDDQALRLEYAQLLSADPKRRDEAIKEYRALVAAKPTPETRGELADLLSGRPEGRAEAKQQYEALLEERPDDTGVRLKYARMLAARREDTPKAVEQYEKVVKADPKNGPAHAGLAQGYAALHKRNQAIREANLAVQYGAKENELLALRRDLMRERDPSLQAFVNGFVQSGRSKVELDGVSGGAGARIDAGSVLTLTARGGGETYSGNVRSFDAAGVVDGYESESAGGGFARGDVDLYLGASDDVGIGAGYHNIGERGYVGRAEYTHLGESWRVGFGVERTLRYDSFVALAGDTINGREIGSARENRLHLQALYEGEKGTFSIEPYAGLVDAKAVSGNPFVGGRIETRYRIFSGDHVDVSPYLGLEGYHYRFNAFAIDLEPGNPKPGGYFSPMGFGSVEPGIAFNIRIGESQFLDLEGGPALQVSKESDPSWDVGAGGRGRLEYVLFLHPSLYWAIGGEVQSLGAAYTRFGASTRLAFEF